MAKTYYSDPDWMSGTGAASRCGVSRPTIKRWVESGIFPEPVRLITGRIFFKKTEVDEWVEENLRVKS